MEFREDMRRAARLAGHHRFNLEVLIPGNGHEPASQWLIEIAEDATGLPIPRTEQGKVNIARVRTHLRQWGAQQESP